MTSLHSNWTTLLWSGTAAVVLSWVMTGCVDLGKFGNQLEPGTPPPNPDQISGYYRTEPRYLSFCAAQTDGGALECAPATLENIPEFLASLMSNPVGILLDDLEGNARIFNPHLDPAPVLPTMVDLSTGELSFSGAATAEPFWKNDETCTRQLFVAEQGQITRYDEPVTESWTEKKLYGELAITFSVLDEFAGSGCNSVLQEVAACYEDANGCGGADATENQDLHAYARAIFGDWVNSGALTVGEIPRAEILLYEVSYQ